MASGYLYAARFNTSSSSYGTCTQTITVVDHPKIETTPIRNVFIAAGHRQRQIDPNQSSSIFFTLPAELRNEIYELLLSPPSRSLKSLADHRTSIIAPTPVYPAILSTCRRINKEAQDILYSSNVFTAHPKLLTCLPHLISAWKPIISPAIPPKIRRWQITIRLDTDPGFTAAQATAQFSGAEYLGIKAWQSMHEGCDAYVLRLFRAVRDVALARVEGSVKPDVAKELEDSMMSKSGEGDGVCLCEDEQREVVCRCCGKVVEMGGRWGRRNAWLGNR